VVTGTLAAGTLRVGDQVTVMPRGIGSRVRNLQIHGEAVDVAQAGHRVAANLTGVEVGQIERGDVLTHPGAFRPTGMLDVRVHMLDNASAPLRHASRIRLHLGAAEHLARVMLLESERLQPGESGLAQLRLESRAVAARGDRLVIRSYSPPHTIAGAIVLNPYPAKHRRRDRGAVIATLAEAESASQDEIVERAALDDPTLAIDREEMARRLGLSPVELDQRIARLLADGRLVRLDPEGFVLNAERYRALRQQILARIESFHQDQPLAVGIAQEDLRTTLSDRPAPRLLQRVVADLITEGRLGREGDRLRLAEFEVRLTPEQQQIAEQIEAIFRDAPFSSPALSDVLGRFGDAAQAQAVARLMLDRGRLVQLGDIVVHHTALERARALVLDHLAKSRTITAAQFRNLIGSSRKYAVPILEHFDRRGITRRLGDERVVGPSAGLNG
jgi:selenocysteine-specific elongation factor